MAYTTAIFRDEIARFLETRKPEARKLIGSSVAYAEIKAAHDVIDRCNITIMELESDLWLEIERTAALEVQLREAKEDLAAVAPPDAHDALPSALMRDMVKIHDIAAKHADNGNV